MEANCQCGAVSFTTPLDKPLALYICHCAECRRQTSSAFGTSAIFPRFPLPDAELLSCYTRPTVSGQTLYCYFCKKCGTRLIHTTPNKNVVSVKGGCLQGLDWARAIHIWTKSAMIPIPEGAESYPEEAAAVTTSTVPTTTTTTTTSSSSSRSRRSSTTTTSSTSYGEIQEALDQPPPPAAAAGSMPSSSSSSSKVGQDDGGWTVLAGSGAPPGGGGGGGRGGQHEKKKKPEGLCELSGMAPAAGAGAGAETGTAAAAAAGGSGMVVKSSYELEGWHA